MRYLNKEALNEQVARESGFDLKTVSHATDFQFVFVAEKIRSGVFDKGVRLPYFGRFSINRLFLNWLKEKMMTPMELNKWIAQLKKQGEGRCQVSVVKLLRLAETTRALYDRLGDEAVDASKVKLGRKSGTPPKTT